MVNKTKLQWIQILRGIAASAVVVHHSFFFALTRGGTGDGADQNSAFAAGVDLFFVISGFVMMMVSDDGLGRDASPRKFIASRIARIVPLYWFYTGMIVALGVAVPWVLKSTVVTPGATLFSLLFVPYADDDAIAPLLRVGWTLNYEMWFYAAFALIISMSLWRRVVMMGLLFAAVFLAGSAIGGDGQLAIYLRNSITFEFVAGMALYVLYRNGVRPSPLQAVMLALLAAVWFGWFISRDDPTLANRFLVWGVPAAIVVFASFALPEVRGRLGRMLEILGDASYSIYLSHMFTLGLVDAVNRKLLGLPPGLAIVALFTAGLAVGVIAYRVIEQPLLRVTRLGAQRFLQGQA